MDKQQRLNQLNQFHEGYRLTEEQIVAEYNRLYRPEITPWSNPELFDPLKPPAGWEYDAWHALWYRLPTPGQFAFEMFIMKLSLWVSLGMVAWAAYCVLMG